MNRFPCLFVLLVAFSLSLVVPCALSHPEGHGKPPQDPIANGLPGSEVKIFIQGDKRIIESNDIPNHPTGKFPNPENPNVIRPQNFHYEVPAEPVEAATITPLRHMDFGVALNGVKFDPGTAEYWKNDRSSIWNMEAIVKEKGTLGIDMNNAHVQPDGAYHYHGIPTGLLRQLHGERKMTQIGWAADGFPIYGPWAYKDAKDSKSTVVEMKSSYRIRNGTRPGGKEGPGGRYDGTYTPDYEYVAGTGDLDECNGRTGVTAEFPQGTYYYVVTKDFPYVPRNFRGTPDKSFEKRPPQGGGPGGGFGPPPGQGPGHRPPPPR